MNSKSLNWFFAVEVILFGLIITGVLPREAALYLGATLIIYFLAVPVENSLVFFVRSIPLFLAMPFTVDFDNFNVWRILVVIIFLKWAYVGIRKGDIKLKEWLDIKSYRTHSVLLFALLVLAVLSLFNAVDLSAGIKRIIYFLNFAVLGVIIYDKASNMEFAKRLIKNSIIPVVIVASVCYIQVVSTYFVDIYQFMRIWGEGIQCRQFGEQWCNIAVQLGNTWFAYYGEQLSLRVFSLFPDSHSFPQFVLLGIPAILALMLEKKYYTTLFKKQRAPLLGLLGLASLFLIVILSGTRGIWAASIGVVLLYFGLILYMKKWELTKLSYDNFVSFKKLGWLLTIFFLMFAAAFPIFSSPQFLVGKSDDILKARIKSILDFGETSNVQRIEIWEKTLSSIKEKPFLGVGIGNYPVVLGQDTRLAKAGSSAHNLYLHIAAEMGILAGLIFIWFLWLLFKNHYEVFVREGDKRLGIYFAATLLYVPWILIYSLTDIAIFDERALLMFMFTMALILGRKNSPRDE